MKKRKEGAIMWAGLSVEDAALRRAVFESLGCRKGNEFDFRLSGDGYHWDFEYRMGKRAERALKLLERLNRGNVVRLCTYQFLSEGVQPEEALAQAVAVYQAWKRLGPSCPGCGEVSQDFTELWGFDEGRGWVERKCKKCGYVARKDVLLEELV